MPTRKIPSILWLIGVLPARTLTALAPVFGQEPENEQERLIAAIRQMGGDVRLDYTRPEKPVVQIHLYNGKTAGIGLEPLTKLTEVDWIGLHASDITEADMAYLQRWPKLKRLGLVETRLTDASLGHLRGITTLEELYLGENAITDAGLERLAGQTNLTILGIEKTKITDAGLERLRPFQKLQWLRIDSKAISEVGLEHLRRLPNLRDLDVRGCRNVRSLKPLAGMPLTDLAFEPANVTNARLDVLRQCKTLRNVFTGLGGNDRYRSQDFWTKIDAGEFKP